MSLGSARLGIAVAGFFAASAVCGGFAGRAADRLGGVRVIRVGVASTVLSLAGIAFLARTWLEVLAALVAAGTGNGIIQPAANRYLVSSIDPRSQGLAFGVKQAAIPVATLLSGLSVSTVATTVGWRWAFAVGAAMAAASLLLIRSSCEQMERRTAGGAGPSYDRRALLTLAFGNACGSAAVNSLGTFFVASAVAVGVADSAAGLWAAAGSALSVVARVVGGSWADRRVKGHLKVVAVMSLAGAGGLVLLATRRPMLFLPAVVVGYGAGWGWAGLLTFAVARTHPRIAGRATGVTQVGASIGACLGPLSFGFLAGGLGFSWAWMAAASALALAAALIARGRRLLGATLGPPDPVPRAAQDGPVPV